jgi:hypothetical protein
LFQHDEPNETDQGRTLSIVLYKSPIALVSTVSRGRPYLVSLVKTVANGDSWRTYERGPSLVGSLAPRTSIRYFYPAFAALAGPVQNIFYSTDTISAKMVPIAQQAGQAVMPRRMAFNMCLWTKPRNDD